MRRIIVIAALLFAVFNTASLAVLFYQLSSGRNIAPDDYNLAEFWLAVCLSIVILVIMLTEILRICKGKGD